VAPILPEDGIPASFSDLLFLDLFLKSEYCLIQFLFSELRKEKMAEKQLLNPIRNELKE
jgi:hypothetical protein